MISPRGNRLGRRADRERGQALVEFALILLPLLILVSGIIYFGIGLNFWLDMNRTANQGARWAAVNNWPPQCPRTQSTCTNSNASTPCAQVNANGSRARLQDVLRCQVRNNPAVTICYPGETAKANVAIGDPVKVKLTRPYTFFTLERLSVTLTATATMRLEQVPTRITNEVFGAGGVCP